MVMIAGLLVLVACESELEPEPVFTREQLLNPETCKECHVDHYNEWSGSMHAYASKDPVFLAMNKRGQEEANLGDFCVQCHAPMAVREKVITDFGDLSNVPDHLQGVTCYFCHNATDVGLPHNNANITLANDLTMRGALGNPTNPGVHGVLQGRSPHHDPRKPESSVMCGTCHDIVTPNGTHFERTLAEYESSVFATSANDYDRQSCQDCHMTKRRLARSAAPGFTGMTTPRYTTPHLWPAVDVALTDFPNQAAMRSAVERCELQSRSISFFSADEGQPNAPWSPGEPYRFTIGIESHAGHAMPSGTSNDRRMWLEVIAVNAAGQEYWWSGRIADDELEESDVPNPKQGDQLCMFRNRFVTAEGKPAHMFWDAVGEPSAQSKLIPAPTTSVAGSHTGFCYYSTERFVTPPAKLKLRLRMRPMGFDVLQDLVDSGHLDPAVIAKMPTFTVAQREITYDPVTRGWNGINVELTDASCVEYECLLDPQSKECTESME
jgi:hypothetical protein